MSIKVRYFASLGEKLGRSENDLAFISPVTVREVWQSDTQSHVIPENVFAAINMEYADFNDPVHDGDEVAFFPPVTGG